MIKNNNLYIYQIIIIPLLLVSIPLQSSQQTLFSWAKDASLTLIDNAIAHPSAAFSGCIIGMTMLLPLCLYRIHTLTHDIETLKKSQKKLKRRMPELETIKAAIAEEQKKRNESISGILDQMKIWLLILPKMVEYVQLLAKAIPSVPQFADHLKKGFNNTQASTPTLGMQRLPPNV